MSEVQTITLENCEVTYTYKDGRVILFGYMGMPGDVIRELMEKYLLPRKRLLEHSHQPEHPQWGENPV